MMTLETRVEIHVLHRQGMSIRAIARHLSCSRETVRRYIRSSLPVADMRYKPRAPRPCKLDTFKPYILERVAAARPHWIPASVLLREIRQRGYDGGYSMLTAFLHPMKHPLTEAVTRFETEPGVQMQVDFTIVRLGHNLLLAFVATLGWSRATFVKFYSNQDSAAWCDGIESALKFFGGTPRQLLFDNAKTIIIAKKLNYGYTDFMSYSIDFRRRILSIKKHEGLSIRETAKRFHIGTTTIVRWTKQIDARPATSRQRKIDKSALERDVEQYPDAYQRERAERFGVCQMAICKALKKLQLTYKKKLCVIQKSTKTLDKHSNKKYNSIKMKEKPLFSFMKVVLITIPHVHTVIRYLEKDVTA